MELSQIGEFLRTYAPADVQNTIAWLSANGYALVAQEGDSTFGAVFVYQGDAEVRITVDRSQWSLDVAPTPGSKASQYDLIVAARQSLDYGALFPQTGARLLGDPLPEQLPVGVSWRDTLPDILQWVHGETVGAGVRYVLVLQWPGSSEADFDALISMEDTLTAALGDHSTVDGHDFGAGEMNIFIETDDPAKAFSDAVATLGDDLRWAEVRAAFRDQTGDAYTILWPQGLSAFSVK